MKPMRRVQEVRTNEQGDVQVFVITQQAWDPHFRFVKQHTVYFTTNQKLIHHWAKSIPVPNTLPAVTISVVWSELEQWRKEMEESGFTNVLERIHRKGKE